MKKYINKIWILAIVLGMGMAVTSCDQYLEETPDNRQELKTVDDLAELLVSGYSGATYNFMEWKSDNTVAILGNDPIRWMTENFTYKPTYSSTDQDTPGYFWSNNYKAIAHANQVLSMINKVSGDDAKKRAAVKGEALIVRAYNHFLLSLAFCKAYDTNADKNLGLPYITAPETSLNPQYERGTLKETYDLIKKDLEEGLALVDDTYYKGLGKYHFNKGASWAFASRFYLFTNDYENCIKYSNMLLGDGVINTTYCRDMEAVFDGTNSKQIANQFIDPALPSNLLLVRKETLTVTRIYRGYRYTKAIFTLLYGNTLQGGSDYRDAQWGYSTIGTYAPPKYGELFKYTTATTGYPYFINPELRAEEVIFNRMEAYVKTGKIDEAIADYNVFAPTRYANKGQLTKDAIVKFYSAAASEEEAMIQFILAERRKEFFREGQRWWDIKRYKIPVAHTDVEGNVFELTAEDERKAIQIPQTAVNNGVAPNPR